MATAVRSLGIGELTRDPYTRTSDDQKREQEMKRAWDAYNGIFHSGNDQWPLAWEKGKEPNPNVIINRCGPAVDTDVAWLFGEAVSIDLVDAPDEAQTWLDQAWGTDSEDSSDDDKMALLQELATHGAVTGHAFLKIDWDSANQSMEFPKLSVLDSRHVRVQTDPHNIKVPLCYIIEYRIPDPRDPQGGTGTFRQVVQMIDKQSGQACTQAPQNDLAAVWQVSDWWRGSRSTGFVPMSEPRLWDYSWPPIEDCPHLSMAGSYYGKSRIPPNAIGVNEAICMVASNEMTISLRCALPILYTIRQGANQREIRYKPGTILETSADIKAVQAYGDLKDLQQQEQDLRADFDEQVHVPAQAFGRMDQFPRMPVSGVAFRLSFGALMSDITKEHRTYGALIRRVSQHMLILKNASWGEYKVQLGWQDPMPGDDLQQAQVGAAALAAGASTKTVLEKYFELDWDTEQENKADEEAEAADVTDDLGNPIVTTPEPGVPPPAPAVVGNLVPGAAAPVPASPASSPVAPAPKTAKPAPKITPAMKRQQAKLKASSKP